MAYLKFADRVKETTTTTGTGTYSLGGAVAGFNTFVAGIGNSKTCYYCCTDNTSWEIGLGTVTDASPDTLARTAILATSAGNQNAINWGAGTKTIFVTIPASAFNRLSIGTDGIDSDGNLNTITGASSVAIGTGNDVSGSGALAVGSSNTVSQSSNAAIGENNSATATGSVAIGVGALANLRGSIATAYYNRSVTGDSQSIDTVVAVQTTNATVTDVKYIGIYDFQIDDGAAYAVRATICARQYGGGSGSVGDSKAWAVDYLVKRSGGSYSLVGSATKTVIANDAAAAAWDVTATATSNTLLTVTGEANKSINWVCRFCMTKAA